MIALVDCNNFYVSCERVFNPALNGKPVVVLSNNDGCIISRSNEAKALGIKMAQPAFKIADLIERNQVAVFSSNYTLYGDMSRRVMTTLAAPRPTPSPSVSPSHPHAPRCARCTTRVCEAIPCNPTAPAVVRLASP